MIPKNAQLTKLTLETVTKWSAMCGAYVELELSFVDWKRFSNREISLFERF